MKSKAPYSLESRETTKISSHSRKSNEVGDDLFEKFEDSLAEHLDWKDIFDHIKGIVDKETPYNSDDTDTGDDMAMELDSSDFDLDFDSSSLSLTSQEAAEMSFEEEEEPSEFMTN